MDTDSVLASSEESTEVSHTLNRQNNSHTPETSTECGHVTTQLPSSSPPEGKSDFAYSPNSKMSLGQILSRCAKD